MNNKSQFALIILAAGASQRMGKPKQMLEFKGKTMLQNAVQTALDSVCHPVMVVLGANADILQPETENFDVQTIINTDWESGMSSSLKIGLEKILETEKQLYGVLIMVCDQPFATAEIINKIVETYQNSNCLIAACQYGETLGVPALFSHHLFSRLLDLENSGGAKQIIEQFQAKTEAVFFPEGIFDIDTPEDYLKLIKSPDDL